VLASQSPRRKEILHNAGFQFEVRSSGIPEIREPGESAEQYVRRLSRQKAFAVPASPDVFVVGADTVVVHGEGQAETILEKPSDHAHAAAMLQTLSGRTHRVLTGLCVRLDASCWQQVEVTNVWFRPLSQEEIVAYTATGEPYDKAGAYAIQGLASRFIPRIEGCYFNVVGLPISALDRLLEQAGFPR
jgi:septum formation protein